MGIWIVYISILIANCGLWLYLSGGFRRAQKTGAARDARVSRPVSIVVAVKNEQDNIEELVAALIAQTRPNVEIVIADDGSEGETLIRLRQHPDAHRLLIVESNSDIGGKKRALKAGILASSNDVLLFTDADCQPDPDWASQIAAYFDTKAHLAVVGYSPFKQKRGFANRVFRYETFVTGFLTAAAVGTGRPYMAVGRNLAYTRQSWETVDGFDRIMQSLSGDDDLLVQQFARERIEVVHAFGPGTYVPTDSPDGVSDWVRQKLRHTSASRFYSPVSKVLLGGLYGSGIGLYFAPAILGSGGWWLLAVAILVQWMVLHHAGRVFREQDLSRWQPVLQVIYSLYLATLAPLGVFLKPRKW